MPIYDKQIPSPVLDGKRQPLSFRWRGQVLHVAEVLGNPWVMTGRWWEQEPETAWWRVRVEGSNGVYELYQETAGDRRWIHYKVYD